MKRTQTMALLVATGALLAVPAIGQADKPVNGTHGHPTGKAKGQGKSCAKKPTVNKGFVVKGTLVTYDAGAPAAGDETVTVNVTKMNKHASRSDLTDALPAVAGLQYTITGADDPFKVQLSGYELDATPADVPNTGDKVRIIGKVAVTRKKCAAPGASVAARYGKVDVRKVKIIEVD